ncbi:MAG: sensor histidine kinase [Luteimonas sp.]
MKLSRFILERQDQILTEWGMFARTYASARGASTDVSLGDHAGQLLVAIAAHVESAQTPDGLQPRADEPVSDTRRIPAASELGALRHQDASSLLQLTAEYRALRAAVLRTWLTTVDAMDAQRAREMVRFNEVIDQALAESVVAFDARSQRDRRQSEEALRESEERYRGIVNTALDYAIFTTDAAGLIDSWPPGAQAVFGWTAEEVIGRHAEVTYTREDRVAQVPQKEMRIARENGVASNVRWHLCADGRRVFIEGAMLPIIDASGEPAGYLKVGRDATERKRWDERQQLLLRELQHRTQNLMAVVLTMFDNTRRTSPDLDALSHTFKGRLRALARVQGLLSRLEEGDRVAFDTLIRTELSSMGALDDAGSSERVVLDGPTDVLLRSGTVQTLALALHELATNAAKYGALAQDQGHLSVRWRAVQRDARTSLQIEWIESAVDMARAASVPKGSSYGRELIEHALPYQLDARTTYRLGADGVTCTIEVPISEAASREGGPS